ncbi:unnamed protein product [Schistosoma turkestanicum]|nr:unnamed protein product [Schistosoma turkestanicum]
MIASLYEPPFMIISEGWTTCNISDSSTPTENCDLFRSDWSQGQRGRCPIYAHSNLKSLLCDVPELNKLQDSACISLKPLNTVMITSTWLCRDHHAFRLANKLPSSVPFNMPFISQQCVGLFRIFPVVSSSVYGHMGRINFISKSREFLNPTNLNKTRALLGAAAAIGIGGLCLYGLSGKNGALSTFDRPFAWPDYVNQRIRATYGYLVASAIIAAGSAVAFFQSPTMCRLMLSGGWLAPIGMVALSMTTGVICQSITYPPSGLNAKHLVWIAHSVALGSMLMPICLAGGTNFIQAAMYTGGIVGSMSLVGMTAPSDRFINWGNPLAIGLGIAVVSLIGSIFLSPVNRFGSGLASIDLYGCLLLFSGYLLHDTQHMIRRAKSHPPPNFHSPGLPNNSGFQKSEGSKPFDPINDSIRILLNAVNIFNRMATMLSNGGQCKI